MSVEGKVSIVTGVTSGLGRGIATVFARQGSRVIGTGRRASLGKALEEEVRGSGGELTFVEADVTRVEDCLATVDAAVREYGRVDVLVNNAGFGLKGKFLDNDIETEQAQQDVLVRAVLRLTHAALGGMVARGHGGVINVSSVAAFLPRGTYSAAKAWVNSFSTWAHNEYADRGVRVMALCPGFVKTEFHERLGVDRENTAPSFLWLEPDFLVRKALADFEAGKAMSIPSKRYRAIVAASKAVPSVALQRYQSFGRK